MAPHARPISLERRTLRSAKLSTIERRTQMNISITRRLVRNPASAVVCALTLMAGAGSAFADDSVNTGYFGGVAIMGYDTVAYFTDGKAVKGSEKYSYEWLGASWHFANDEHRKLFAANPVSYAPQFG